MRVARDEITFHPLSYSESEVRLFSWRGDIYRGIGGKLAGDYRKMFETGLVDSLVGQRLLVGTEVTDITLDGFEFVIKHDRIPFVTYAWEWCGPMLKEAALCLLDVEIELSKRGWTLRDAHPWNVLFDGTRPLFVDFGSFISLDERPGWVALDEFRSFFLYPLLLVSLGQSRLARLLLQDWDTGVGERELGLLLRGRLRPFGATNARPKVYEAGRRVIPKPLRPMVKKILNPTGSRDLSNVRARIEFLLRLRQTVEELEIPELRTDWSNYYEGAFPPWSPTPDWTPKHHAVVKVLSTRPSSVLDLGANRGWYSQFAAMEGARVVAVDNDEGALTLLHRDLRGADIDVLPIFMDFKDPSPGRGVGNRIFLPATDRLQCELVMALALVHHLVFKNRLTFDHITDGLASFTTSRVLVEFIPPSDEYVKPWMTPEHSWYSLEKFMGSLRRHFSRIETLESHPKDRVLLLCAK